MGMDGTLAQFETILVEPDPRIAVDHCGQGPLVLLLHGIGGNRTNWRYQLEALCARFHAAAWDARGYLDSDDYEGDLEFADFARDIVRVCDSFGVARVHLVGLSMGGRIALDFALRYPERLATMTLSSTFAGFSTSLSPEKQEEFVRLRLKPLVEDGKEPVDLGPAVVRSLIGPNCSDSVYREMIDSMALLRKESYIKAVKAAAAYDRSGDLGNVAAPALVIAGEHDPQPPAEVARDMAGRIPGAEYVVIPDSGHLTNLEQPEAFNAAVLDFLERHRDVTDKV